MLLKNSPCLRVPRLKIDADSWNGEDLPCGLTRGSAIELRQFWRSELQAEFRPGRVWVGCTPEGLQVFARLEDDRIHSPLVGFNEPAFQTGDVFEIFLQPYGAEHYYEFHVNPDNQLFQLRIPSSREFRADRRDGSEGWKIREPVIRSRVQLLPEDQEWRVWATIPFSAVNEGRIPLPSEPWRFSFSRYDHSDTEVPPVLSSTSPHTQLDFHCIEEWGVLEWPS
jgi:hypothetical protein